VVLLVAGSAVWGWGPDVAARPVASPKAIRMGAHHASGPPQFEAYASHRTGVAGVFTCVHLGDFT